MQERNCLDAKLQETRREKQELQQENVKLSKKIQDLAEEVSSSRAYIDKLLKTSHETEQSDWEIREEKYKKVVQNLRQQIRKQASAVSIDLVRFRLYQNHSLVFKYLDAILHIFIVLCVLFLSV